MAEHRKLNPEETTSAEPLSPELALVDPQLADLARERLPSERFAVSRAAPRPRDDRPGRPSAVAESDVELSETSSDYAEDVSAPEKARPRRRRVFTVALGLLALVAAGFPIVAHEVTVGDSAYGTIPNPTESKPVQREADTRQRGRANEGQRSSARTASPHSTKPAAKPKTRSQSVRPSAVPTRVFIWPAVSRATFYKVEFFRRGRKIFEAAPTMPRIELPLRWVYKGRHFRLTPRTYRWDVRAAFGPRSRPRYGKLITQSTWNPQ
jgi:hypothetical protein